MITFTYSKQKIVMKSKTKKIMQYSALALSASAVLPLACKQEETEPDDPNINVTTPNLTITRSTTNIDTSVNFLTGEFELYVTDNAYLKSVFVDVDYDTYFQNGIYTSVNGNNLEFVPTLNKGTLIDTSASVWNDNNDDGYLHVFDKDPSPGAGSGIAGQGDKYIAFRVGGSGSFKYGWMKVNIPSDINSVTIKEVGMSNLLNTPIKVGAK